MSYKNPLVPITENMFKEGINDMEKKRYVVQKTITHHKEIKLKIDVINETDKTQAPQSKKG